MVTPFLETVQGCLHKAQPHLPAFFFLGLPGSGFHLFNSKGGCGDRFPPHRLRDEDAWVTIGKGSAPVNGLSQSNFLRQFKGLFGWVPVKNNAVTDPGLPGGIQWPDTGSILTATVSSGRSKYWTE